MKVIFMAKNKPSTIEGLRFLLQQGIEVAAVVAPQKPDDYGASEHLRDIAAASGLPCVSDEELYEQLAGRAGAGVDLVGVDMVLSLLFWKRIREPLIILPRLGCVNFHPAPLPEVRGVCGYTFAIYEEMKEWGVSAHFVDVNFDTGDLIQVDRFPIIPTMETAASLEKVSQRRLVELFKSVVRMGQRDGVLPRRVQGNGRYFSKRDFERVREVLPTDSAAVVHRKIRACWSPPFPGASVRVGGEEFTLIDQSILNELKGR